jgi:chemotaxis protein CheD
MTEIFLHPGEYFVGHAGCTVRTVLGSCVSITLWHPVLRVGAMSHFVLSSRAPGSHGALDARYAEEAMSLMLRDLRNERVNLRECQAKLFGGGNMFPGHPGASLDNIGHKNSETARMLVRAQNIPIVSESLSGLGHRQIVFEIASGDVWQRQVKPLISRRSGAP